MRNRKPITKKVVSATANGEVIRHEVKKSVQSRTKELLMALGIDEDTFKFQSAMRMYNRMSQHQYLGINY